MKPAFLLVCIALALPACAVDSADLPDDDAAESDLTKNDISGFFTSYGQPDTGTQGHIDNLHLRKDGTFEMALMGEYGCDVYAGYSCPSTWNDGRTGRTEVKGTWKAGASGVTLQPTGEGRPSAPIPLTIKVRAGSKLTVTGTIVPNRKIGAATMDGEVRYGKAAKVTPQDLDGTWKFVSPVDRDGDQQRLNGTLIYVRGYEHVVRFDAAAGTLREERVENGRWPRAPKYPDSFTVGAVPSGTGPGVIVMQSRGGWPDTARIVSFGGGKMSLDVGGDAPILLERQ